MKNFVLILLACAIFAGPAACLSPWFTASFNDLKFTLYRYGYCVNGLQPVASPRLNETDFLVNQIKRFLDQGNYDNEQLANVSSLMDTICRTTNAEPSYPISMHVNISSFNSSSNPHAKSVRCHAIDEALDSMYHVFKRAALNRSEPLDFSSIQFYPNATDKSASYNLSDLINTSWITSEVVLEHVCSITNATKEYVLAKSSNSTAQPRREVTTSNPLYELISLLMDPLLGLQKRLSWETTNTLELIQTRVGSGLGSMGQTIVYGYNRTRDTLLWRPRGRTNSLAATNVTDVRLTTNLTTLTTRLPRLNSTGKPTTSMDNVQTSTSSVTAKPSSTLASVTSTTSMPGTSVTTNQPTTTTTHQTTSTTYQPTSSTSSNFNATTRVTGANRTTST